MRASSRVRAAAVLYAAVLTTAGTARAEPPPRRILVHADGANGADAVRDIAAALPDGLYALPKSADEAAWRGSAPPRGRHVDPATHLARAVRAAHTDAGVVVMPTPANKGSAPTMRLVVLAADGSQADIHVPAGDREALARALGRLLPTALDRDRASTPAARDDVAARAPTPPPASAAPLAPSAPPRDDAPRPSTATSDPAHATVDVSAGVEIGMREFRYTDRRTPALRDYSLGAAPLLSAAGEVYPFASTTAFLVSDLGVAGTYARAFGLSSSSSSQSVGTAWSRFAVGPRLRARPFGDHGALVYASVQYGAETFALASADAVANALLPSVAYRYVRPAADVRVALGRVSLHGGAAYLVVLDGGDVASRFPSSSVGGVEAHGGAALALRRGLELRADVAYRRFFYAMHPAQTSAYVAGGALDQFAGATVALAMTL